MSSITETNTAGVTILDLKKVLLHWMRTDIKLVIATSGCEEEFPIQAITFDDKHNKLIFKTFDTDGKKHV